MRIGGFSYCCRILIPRRDSNKRVTQGWGSNEGNKELEAEEAGETDANAEPPAAASWGEPTQSGDDPWAATPAAEEPAVDAVQQDERPVREEEEDVTKTYKEFKEEQERKLASQLQQLELREANDGDSSAFDEANRVVKKDEDEEAYYAGAEVRAEFTSDCKYR